MTPTIPRGVDLKGISTIIAHVSSQSVGRHVNRSWRHFGRAARFTSATARQKIMPWNCKWRELKLETLAIITTSEGRTMFEGKFFTDVKLFFSSLFNTAMEAWHFQLAEVDKSSITVGKVAFAFALVIFGFILSKYLSRRLATRLLPVLRFNKGAISALESIAFYFLLVLFVVIAFRIVHIPLTVFTLLGGAIAIGVGFGSQNIMSNFISGLIILAEQPIRVGDIIDFAGTRGTVKRIGARSTVVTSPENYDVIVPNSILLQSSVINWTLSNNQVKRQITIGVAYGSATERVKEVLLEVAKSLPGILPNPSPDVYFTNFGESSLDFELRFWVSVRGIGEALRIESDARFAIDKAFRENSISISFPQRDLHVDSLRPIEVKMVS